MVLYSAARKRINRLKGNDMIKDYTISKKIDGKYVPMISIKDGWKFSFMPAFKQEMKNWLNGSEEYWNGNIKEWDAKPGATTQPATQSAHAQAKQDGYQPEAAELDDTIPF